jgi:hypothetical protein
MSGSLLNTELMAYTIPPQKCAPGIDTTAADGADEFAGLTVKSPSMPTDVPSLQGADPHHAMLYIDMATYPSQGILATWSDITCGYGLVMFAVAMPVRTAHQA